MKNGPNKTQGVYAGKSETMKIVKREVAVIERASKKASASRKAAIAFLEGAGIVTAKGNLTRKYR